MDGQVEYAKTIRDINAIMNAAASEYKTHIAAMAKDAEETSKLAAEKKKLEIQLDGAKKRTEMLRNEYDAMAQSSKTTTGQLAAKHNQLMKSERAEIALKGALDKVNDGLSEQADEARKAQEMMEFLETQSNRLETQTQKLNAEYEYQKATLGDNADKSEKLALKMAHLNDVHEVAKDKVENYEQQLELAKQQYGENSREVDRYEIQLLEARTAEQKLANEIKATNTQLNDQVSRLAKTSDELKKLGKRLKDVGSDMSDIGKDLSLKVTAPVVALAGSLVKTGVEFKAFKQESKQAFSVLLGSAEEAEKHMDRIMDFAKTTPFAFPDLVSANRKLVSFGVEAENTEAIMEAIANNVAAMGGGAQEIDTMADIFAKITSQGKITGQELNRLGDQGVNALAILANQAGVSMEDMRKQISNGAIDSEKAINGLVDGIMNGTDGINGKTVAMGGSLDALKNTWAGAIDSMKGAWRRAADDIVSEDMFENMIKAVHKLTELINKLPQIIGPLAAILGDILIKLIDNVTDLADWFLNLEPAAQQLGVIFGVIAVAIGPVLLVLGKLITFIGGIVEGVGVILPILSKLRVVFTALTGPVGLVIAIVSALIAIFVALYKNNEEFRDGVLSIWEQIKEAFFTALTFIQEFVMTVMEGVKVFFQEQLEKIREFWDENGEHIIALVTTAFESVLEIIKMVMGIIKGVFESVWPIITGVVKVAWNLIKTIISTALDLVLGVIDVALKLLRGDWEGAWESIKKTAEKIMNNIIDFFKNIDLVQIGKDIINGLIKGIGSMVGAVGDSIKKIGGKIKDTFTSFFKIRSPSRIMADEGEELPAGVGVGIEKGEKDVVKKMRDFSKSTRDAFDIDPDDFDFDPPRPPRPSFGGGSSATSPMSVISNIGNDIKEGLKGVANDIAVHVYLDSRELNSQLAPGMSKELNSMNKINARAGGVIIR